MSNLLVPATTIEEKIQNMLTDAENRKNKQYDILNDDELTFDEIRQDADYRQICGEIITLNKISILIKMSTKI